MGIRWQQRLSVTGREGWARKALAAGGHKVAVERVTLITEEGLRASLPRLGHMMRQTGDDETSEARDAVWSLGRPTSVN